MNQHEILKSLTVNLDAGGRRDFSCVILGAGCAGLSLAWHLIEAGFTEPILLLEGRSEYRNDRTWCYWSVEPTPFDDLVDYSWSSWEVIAADDQRATGYSESSPYLHLRSDRFYQRILEKLRMNSQVTLKLGQRIEEVREDLNSVTIRTAEGDYTSQHVFDSTGITTRLMGSLRGSDSGRQNRSGGWLQHFSGQRIRTDRPVFDPDRLTLMDHRVTQEDGPHFVYLLPYSSTEALIENTYFFPASISSTRHAAEITDYLARFHRLGRSEFKILGEESGAIPMERCRSSISPRGRIIPIGLAGGAARPATGYAFLRIQRQSRSIASLITAGLDLLPGLSSFGSLKYQLFDSIMLASLRRSPELAPAFFAALFQRADSGSVMRFLTERSSLTDDLRVVRSVLEPKFIGMITKWLFDGRSALSTVTREEEDRLAGSAVEIQIKNRPVDQKFGLDFHQGHL